MQELYLSSKAFITITTGNEESVISNLIEHKKVICLFTDKTNEDINNLFNTSEEKSNASEEKIDDDNLIRTYCQKKDRFPCSGFMMKEALENDEPITRFSRSIILLGKNEKALEKKNKGIWS